MTIFPRVQSIDHLNAIRASELAAVAALFPKSGRVLEIGAGTGSQAQMMVGLGYDVVALERADTGSAGGGEYYRAHWVFPIVDYDG